MPQIGQKWVRHGRLCGNAVQGKTLLGPVHACIAQTWHLPLSVHLAQDGGALRPYIQATLQDHRHRNPKLPTSPDLLNREFAVAESRPIV
jgi:hypothetical protein